MQVYLATFVLTYELFYGAVRILDAAFFTEMTRAAFRIGTPAKCSTSKPDQRAEQIREVIFDGLPYRDLKVTKQGSILASVDRVGYGFLPLNS